MLKRSFYLVVGMVSLCLGFIGIVMPLLPTVPFILLAAYCFARSSKRMHAWLLTHPWFAQALADWQTKKAINAKLKKKAYIVVIASFSISILVVPLVWVKIMLGCMCVALLLYLRSIPQC
ncbi:YbaN family protein [Paraferrimonas haliotis]|uniref:YbaN family protein n=1 Tax=Paraferrimonas haliotis TaxID=2013866 RepID=UPI000BA90F94|nr:YbaN family protein [Paraferrimonas haliotis]